MDGATEQDPPHYNLARTIELTKLPDGSYELVFTFDAVEGGKAGTNRKMAMSTTVSSDAEAIWEAEQELRDIFGQFPSRRDGQAPPIVATWTAG